MLFNELGNFKYVMLLMLIPISNLWMNGFIAGAVWIGILVYVVPPVLAYMLDRYEVGHPNQMYSGQHHYRQGNRTPRLNHESLLGGAMIASQLNQLHDNPIAGIELSDNTHSLSQRAADWDAWESENSRFANDILSHTRDATDDWSHFHAHDYNSSPFSHHDIFDSHGINPANGLPMMDSSIDIHGNMYGTNSVDDTFTSNTWDSIFDHHSSFDSTNAFSHHDDFSSSCMDSNYNMFDDYRH